MKFYQTLFHESRCLFMGGSNPIVGLAVILALSSPAGAEKPISPSMGTNGAPDPTTSLSGNSTMEEGKAFYESGQYMAALGKFMTVLRSDPHDPDARQYLSMVIDAMRHNPSSTTSAGGAGQSNSDAQNQLRLMLQKRALFTLDLKAIPNVEIVTKGNATQVSINSSLLFADQSGGLREQGIPVLDRVTAWLKTYGEQPVIIHCYPEELQDPSVNGSLFLHRYSELYNFFVNERNMPPTRFLSADLLQNPANPPDPGIAVSTTAARIVIETVGSQTELLQAMPSNDPRHALSRWLELSITESRPFFNPEEGEWVSLDLAALGRTGLRSWSFKITPDRPNAAPVFSMQGKGNLLMRVSWDGHDQKTEEFVPQGTYVCHLTAVDPGGAIDEPGDIKVQVQRTTDEPALTQRTAPRKTPKKAVKKVAAMPVSPPKPPIEDDSAASTKAAASAPAVTATPPASDDDSDSLIDSKAAPAAAPAPAPADADSGDSVHAIWKQVIEFEPGQADLKPTVKASLERIGKTLEVYPLQKVRIVGFASQSEDNAAQLAQQRAQAVRSILVDEYHVDDNRVLVAGGKVSAASGASKVELSITN